MIAPHKRNCNVNLVLICMLKVSENIAKADFGMN